MNVWNSILQTGVGGVSLLSRDWLINLKLTETESVFWKTTKITSKWLVNLREATEFWKLRYLRLEVKIWNSIRWIAFNLG